MSSGENLELLKQLIAPWKIFFDKSTSRNYYYNSETKTSVWDLPPEMQLKLE